MALHEVGCFVLNPTQKQQNDLLANLSHTILSAFVASTIGQKRNIFFHLFVVLFHTSS